MRDLIPGKSLKMEYFFENATVVGVSEENKEKIYNEKKWELLSINIETKRNLKTTKTKMRYQKKTS